MKKEEEAKRLHEELEACQSGDPDASLPSSVHHFSSSEMARVVMEKNQYKQQLIELQESDSQSQFQVAVCIIVSKNSFLQGMQSSAGIFSISMETHSSGRRSGPMGGGSMLMSRRRNLTEPHV